MKRLIFATVITACLSVVASGESQHLTPPMLQHLGLEAGLSSSYVNAMAHDKRGIVWVATEDGLNIFDGSRFIPIFKDENSPGSSLSGNELNTLLDDPEKPIMWIGTQRAGLNAFNYSDGTVKHLRHNPADSTSLITDDITCLAATDNGKLLVATFWRGLDVFDPATGEFSHYNNETVEGMPDCRIWTVVDGGDGDTVYLGHDDGLIELSLRNRTARNYPSGSHSLPGTHVSALAMCPHHGLLVGTDDGLSLFDRDTHTFRRLPGLLSDARVFDIEYVKGGRFWIATEFNGVFELDMNKGFTPEAVSRPSDLTLHNGHRNLDSATIRTIAIDAHGNKWLGYWGHGVVFIGDEPPLFTSFSVADKGNNVGDLQLTNATASCVVFDNRGRLWVGTDGGGINVFDGNRLVAVYTNPAGRSAGNHLQTGLCDQNGNMWFGAFNGGLYFFDSRTNQFKTIELEGRDNTDIRSLYRIGNTIYAATGRGIYEIDANSHEVEAIYYISLCRDIAVDMQGNHWIATFGSGLLVFDKDWREKHVFNVEHGFPSNTVNDVFVDDNGNVWAATGEGLVEFCNPADSVYTVYRATEGLASSMVNAITQDRSGNIWVSTNKGISMVDSEGNIAGFDHRDNIPMGAFMSKSVAMDSTGMLYFGALNGLCRFDPRQVLAVTGAPDARISQFEVYESDKSPVDYATMGQLQNARTISLNAKQNTIAITANIADFNMAGRVEYRFRLKGFEDKWFSNGTNSVVFRNLPPGKYTFQINTRIRNQEWSQYITSVNVVINPPLWLTWWAKLFYCLVALGVILLLVYLYLRRQKAEALYQLEKKRRVQFQEFTDERLRFYTNITHELRTPLTLIVGPLEDTLRGDGLPERERQRLSVINRNAQRLLKLVNQILDFRKTEASSKRLCIAKANIVPVVYETVLKYKELIGGEKIKINIATSSENIVLPFDKEAITVILDNLISNALKYTSRGSIDIRCMADKENGRDFVEISVADTGYGISSEALPNIFNRYYQEPSAHQASGTGIGLALVKNLTDLHHGTITVDSKVGQGTTFTLRLWIDEQYPEAIHLDEDSVPTRSDTMAEDAAVVEATVERERPVVLVVEDNDDLRDYISESFTDLFDVRTAQNGQEGLEKARTSMPNIIISDIMMPIMDGMEMTRALKSDILTSHIPVILLTAKNTELDREDGYRAGADSYLTKPFSSQLLISRVDNLLRAHRLLAARTAPVLKTGSEDVPQPDSTMETPAPVPEATLAPIDVEFLERLDRSVRDHISSENVDVAFLADAMCMSRATLYRKVKALTGLSPNEYIRKIRMQVAEQLLAEGVLTVSEVSFKVGINSTPYFRQCFKEEFGINPSDYQASLRKPS